MSTAVRGTMVAARAVPAVSWPALRRRTIFTHPPVVFGTAEA
jgi:hypothetical protein